MSDTSRRILSFMLGFLTFLAFKLFFLLPLGTVGGYLGLVIGTSLIDALLNGAIFAVGTLAGWAFWALLF